MGRFLKALQQWHTPPVKLGCDGGFFPHCC
jgi:hypothetical protein